MASIPPPPPPWETETPAPPWETEAKFFIGDREPLFWLVSVLFTDKFWQRDVLTRARFPLSGVSSLDEILPAEFKDWSAMNQAVEAWVESDPAASACYAHAKQVIAAGELSWYSPEADEWGDKPYHQPERDVDSYPFMLWAEKHQYPVSQEVVNAARGAARTMIYRQQEAEKRERAYPAITQEDFARLQKHPLWRVGEAIMYVMGRRARNEGKEAEFGKGDKLFQRLQQFAYDAHTAGQLDVTGFIPIRTAEEENTPLEILFLEAKVRPGEFVGWAEGLPLTLPMLHQAASETSPPTTKPEPYTPEMRLLFAAMEHFAHAYPDPQNWPGKKNLTPWLVENAPRFGIEKLSKNMYDAMDTLMRPVEARVGGIKRKKG